MSRDVQRANGPLPTHRIPAALHQLKKLPDPRHHRTRRHPLVNILFLLLCASIAGAQNFVAMHRWAQVNQSFLARFLNLDAGVPSHFTLRRVVSRLDPVALAQCLQAWVAELRFQQLHGSQPEMQPDDFDNVYQRPAKNEVVAIDGKTLRASLDGASGKSALHVLNAFATTRRVTLGIVPVADHENEIVGIPQLLDMLHLEGCVVTMDAMGCHKHIAAQIIRKKAHYLLALKKNHPNLWDDANRAFEHGMRHGWRTPSGAPMPHWHNRRANKAHGRKEVRRLWVLPSAGLDPDGEWDSFESLIVIRYERETRDKTGARKSLVLTRFFVSSLPCGSWEDFWRIFDGIGRHWRVENSLHWMMDVEFGEDANRSRCGSSPLNLASLRRVVLDLFRAESQVKDAISGKRQRAGWDRDYLLTVLTGAPYPPLIKTNH